MSTVISYIRKFMFICSTTLSTSNISELSDLSVCLSAVVCLTWTPQGPET